jgi:hypothetical protein
MLHLPYLVSILEEDIVGRLVKAKLMSIARQHHHRLPSKCVLFNVAKESKLERLSHDFDSMFVLPDLDMKNQRCEPRAAFVELGEYTLRQLVHLRIHEILE